MLAVVCGVGCGGACPVSFVERLDVRSLVVIETLRAKQTQLVFDQAKLHALGTPEPHPNHTETGETKPQGNEQGTRR